MHGIDIYAVAGDPALHSLSPFIFRRAFEATETTATYTRLAADSALEAMETARAIGMRGLNITSPFKEEMLPLVDELDDSAKKAGAINSIIFEDGRALGFNVDGEGVIAMCAKANFNPEGARAIVLGAGGAARAAAYALKESGSHVTIVNRSEERGRRAADALGVAFVPLASARETIAEAKAIFACWPKSAHDFDPSYLSSDQIVFDSNYGTSIFALAARKAGARYMGGVEWLLGQADAVFEIFTGEAAPSEAMKDALSNVEQRRGHIILAGMMGTGKTLVAEGLAPLLNLNVIDTDLAVEEHSGRKISDIFEQSGEPEFRRLEAQAVMEALSGPRAVIALGGGALTNPELAKLARERGEVIWLWASPVRCAERASDGSRPLIAGSDPRERLEEILEGRLASYAVASDLIVSTENRSAGETAGKIRDEISKSGKG